MNEHDFALIRKKALAQAKKRDKEVANAIAQGANEYRYFDIQKNWRRLKPIAESAAARVIIDRDMLKYAKVRQMDLDEHMARVGNKNFSSCLNFTAGDYPYQYDSCDWRYGRRGPNPDYWRFACHSACHWVVNLSYYIASTAYPKVNWQIITSNKHSSVVDLESKTFFDLNWSALNVGIPEIYAATLGTKHTLLPVGQELFLLN